MAQKTQTAMALALEDVNTRLGIIEANPNFFGNTTNAHKAQLMNIRELLQSLLPVERGQIEAARREGYAEGQKDIISDRYFQDRER